MDLPLGDSHTARRLEGRAPVGPDGTWMTPVESVASLFAATGVLSGLPPSTYDTSADARHVTKIDGTIFVSDAMVLRHIALCGNLDQLQACASVLAVRAPALAHRGTLRGPEKSLAAAGDSPHAVGSQANRTPPPVHRTPASHALSRKNGVVPPPALLAEPSFDGDSFHEDPDAELLSAAQLLSTPNAADSEVPSLTPKTDRSTKRRRSEVDAIELLADLAQSDGHSPVKQARTCPGDDVAVPSVATA